MNPLKNLNSSFKIAIFLLLTGSSAMSHQAPADSLITLDDAIAIALKNSLEIQIAKNDVEANTLLNNYGVAGGLPTIAGTASNVEQIQNITQELQTGPGTKRRGADGNNTNAGITASLLLYNGKRVVATKMRLAELQNQSSEVLNSQIQNVIAAVMTSYYDVVRQLSYMNTVRFSIIASQKRLEIIEVRKTAGMANNADLFQAQIDLNTLSQTLTNQQLAVDVSKSELLRLLAMDPKSPVAVRDTILVDQTINIDNVLEKLAVNADIKAADSQIRISELIIRETAALRYPTVRLNLGYNYTRAQSSAGFTLLNKVTAPSAGVTLNVPIYNGGAFKRQQQVAEINANSAKSQKQVLIRDYSSQAVKMFQTYKSSLEQLESQKANYKLSQQLLDLTLQRFQLIQATIIDVREAQRSFEEAGYRLINLNYAAKSSEIELKRLTNTLML
ncbi:TolC family protein [Dyadobacter subterraneus]|uniref:TolC family protein n=1 Tax=Dyadobacter subterraneus TaxID=2773304 RepID=A0ABR9WG68_9BACT|nr:TolC family protein [Dyadobacter subterraneus]MBE9464502.1 TolC family protein [Dyadobacter subterraneus]